MTVAARNILIIGPSWVGDMVMIQSLCAALAQQDDSPMVDIIAPSTKDKYSRNNPICGQPIVVIQNSYYLEIRLT